MPRVGFLRALWFSIIGFIERLLFKKSPSPSLPLPVTTSYSVRVSAARSPTETSPPDNPFSPSLRSTPSFVDHSTSDQSLQVGDLEVADIPRLPSPWSPAGGRASSDVWMSVDGLLVNASGPVTDGPDDSLAVWTTLSRMSTTSSSALDALGISALVDLDQVQDSHVDARDDPTTHIPKWTHAALVTPPRKRRETISSVPHAGARATKCLSTPLTKLDNVGVSHVRSATSISSMAYEFRMGLFADGRSMTALISLLDQASPESRLPHEGATQPVVVV